MIRTKIQKNYDSRHTNILIEASKEAPEKETSAPVLDKADVDAKESIVSVNKDQANSGMEDSMLIFLTATIKGVVSLN